MLNRFNAYITAQGGSYKTLYVCRWIIKEINFNSNFVEGEIAWLDDPGPEIDSIWIVEREMSSSICELSLNAS